VAPTYAEFLEAKEWSSLVQAYLANTSFVDHCLGVILDALEEGPNRDDTIVVLWSDHGFHLGEKQHIAKRTLWEESTRVPLLFAGPEIEPGDCAEPASLLDIYPTLLELVGLPVASRLEGISLVPQIEDPTEIRETPALTSSYFGNHAVRDRNWRYIRYADGAEELYDHRVDPGEKANLAADPNWADEKARLASFLPTNAAEEVKPFEQREQVRQGVIK
ncbi:MAG: sulfatase-like hydrolase/transferase, partial [Verrucomicrobiota bacterium]